VVAGRVMRALFVPKKEVTIDGVKLHLQELHNLYSSSDIISIIISRRMRITGQAASV
jgi:hypothetical protein